MLQTRSRSLASGGASSQPCAAAMSSTAPTSRRLPSAMRKWCKRSPPSRPLPPARLSSTESAALVPCFASAALWRRQGDRHPRTSRCAARRSSPPHPRTVATSSSTRPAREPSGRCRRRDAPSAGRAAAIATARDAAPPRCRACAARHAGADVAATRLATPLACCAGRRAVRHRGHAASPCAAVRPRQNRAARQPTAQNVRACVPGRASRFRRVGTATGERRSHHVLRRL